MPASPNRVTRVVRVTSLMGFQKEAPLEPTLNGRSPIVRLLNYHTESQHFASLILSAQSVNTAGEVVWLAEVHTVSWLYGKPFGKNAESVSAGMVELERVVREWLTAQGYDVRVGDFGLSDSFKPLAADFECARWVKVDEDQWRVEARSMAPEEA